MRLAFSFHSASMKDLSAGSIPGHIASMSIQMGIGILVQTLYFFTDLYFVSKLGDAAIAGVSSAGNIWFVVLALTQILNVGTVALVSNAVGAQQRDRANLVFNQSLALSDRAGCAGHRRRVRERRALHARHRRR